MINYPYIEEYIRRTIKPTSGILSELEIFAKKNHVPIIHPEVASFLTVTGSIVKPYRILEIGTAIGYSSILMSQNLISGGKIDTIERYELMVERAKVNIEKAGLKGVINVIMGDALEVLRCLDKQYDMVFLDAAKGQYMEFLPEIMRMLKSGGVLVSDNILFKGMVATDELVIRRQKTIVTRMREYISCICSSEELDTSLLPIGDGVAISYKK